MSKPDMQRLKSSVARAGIVVLDTLLKAHIAQETSHNFHELYDATLEPAMPNVIDDFVYGAIDAPGGLTDVYVEQVTRPVENNFETPNPLGLEAFQPYDFKPHKLDTFQLRKLEAFQPYDFKLHK